MVACVKDDSASLLPRAIFPAENGQLCIVYRAQDHTYSELEARNYDLLPAFVSKLKRLNGVSASEIVYFATSHKNFVPNGGAGVPVAARVKAWKRIPLVGSEVKTEDF